MDALFVRVPNLKDNDFVRLWEALPAACAIEYIHISSLIFDDLPAMDNAQTRHEQPALHIRYGEGIAILVAIALLNRAYELVAATEGPMTRRMHEELTRSIGPRGMIGGQVADLSGNPGHNVSPGLAPEDQEFERVKLLKAVSLFRLSLMFGGLMAGLRAKSCNYSKSIHWLSARRFRHGMTYTT